MSSMGPDPWEGPSYSKEYDQSKLDDMSALEFSLLLAIAIPVIIFNGITDVGKRTMRQFGSRKGHTDSQK